MSHIVSPRQFISVFMRGTKDKEKELMKAWGNMKQFEDAMLNTHDYGLIATVADSLGLKYFRGYFDLSGVFHEGGSSVLAKQGIDYPKSLAVIIEYEGFVNSSYIVLNISCVFNAPLKVIISRIDDERDIKKVLKNYTVIIKEANVSGLQKYLVIFAIRLAKQIDWQSYVYNKGKFHTIS